MTNFLPVTGGALLGIYFLFLPTTLQQDIPAVVWGDFESLPGGRGNIAEFGKALRLPSFADKNIVQFYQDGNVSWHRFLFANSSNILAFPFTFGEAKSLQIHDKTIEYTYNLETSGDPYRATIFARYEELNGMMRFTVEAVFTRTGMVSTYTHADVLDSIMARRSYRRLVPKHALGYYENDKELESKNFKEFSQTLATPPGASFSKNNKIYFGQSGKLFMIKHLLDPESAQITFPFAVGEKQRKLLSGKVAEYIVDVEKGAYPNITLIRAQIRQPDGAGSYVSEFIVNGKTVKATYKRDAIVATRTYRRALPLHFYGTFAAVPDADDKYAEFNSVFQDSSIGLAESPTKIRFYRQGADFHQEIANIFSMALSVDIPFQLDAHTPLDILGKSYKISYHYDGGEKPILHTSFENAEEYGFSTDYTFSGNGIMATYRRSGTLGDVTAKRFYKRLLPSLVLGRYESVENSDAFKSFANGIFFPELTSKTTMEFAELPNGTYVQKFSYGPGVSTTFQEVPFILGAKHEQLVKEKWVMEYSYNAWDGERTFLVSIFTEKPNGTNAPTFGEFSRVADFTKDGFTSVYTLGNMTAKRTYRRIG